MGRQFRMNALKYFHKRMYSGVRPVAICTSIVEGSRISSSTHRQVLALLITLLAKQFQKANANLQHHMCMLMSKSQVLILCCRNERWSKISLKPQVASVICTSSHKANDNPQGVVLQVCHQH